MSKQRSFRDRAKGGVSNSPQAVRALSGGLGVSGFLLLATDTSISSAFVFNVPSSAQEPIRLSSSSNVWRGDYALVADGYLSYASFNNSITLGSHDDSRYYDAVVDASGGFASSHYQSLKTGGSSLFGGGIQAVSTEQPELGLTINDLAGECADNLGEEGKSAEQFPECKDENQAFPVHSNLAVVDAPISLDAFQAVAYGGSGSGSGLSFVTGAVIDGYIEGAQVFLDINGNMVWDEGLEPVATTDAQGAYSFSTAANPADYSVVALGGVDVTTGAEIDVLLAPIGVTYVTPISTLVEYGVRAGDDSLIESLGFTLDDLNSDPVSTGNEAFLKTGASLLTAAKVGGSLITKLAEDASGSELTAAERAAANQENVAQMFSKLAAVAVEARTADLTADPLAGFKVDTNGNQLGDVSALLSSAIQKLATDKQVDAQQASVEVGSMVQSIVKKIAESAIDDAVSWVDAAREGQRGLAETVSNVAIVKGAADRYVADVDAYIKASKASAESLITNTLKIDPADVIAKDAGSRTYTLQETVQLALGAGYTINNASFEPASGEDAANYNVAGLSWSAVGGDLTLEFDPTAYSGDVDAGSFGDFNLTYQIDNANGGGNGFLKLQLVRSFSAVVSDDLPASVDEPIGDVTNTIALKDLLSLNAFGDGMQLSVFYSAEGLESGGLKIDIPGEDLIAVDSALGRQISEDALQNQAAFDAIKFVIDPNYAGQIDFTFLVRSQYGSAEYKVAVPDIGLLIEAKADGLTNPNTIDGLVVGGLSAESGVEDQQYSLFDFVGDSLNEALYGESLEAHSELYFLDADGSEAFVLLLGLQDVDNATWDIPSALLASDEQKALITNQDVVGDHTWVAITEKTWSEGGANLEAQLKSIGLTPDANYAGELAVDISYQIGTVDGDDYAFEDLKAVATQSIIVTPVADLPLRTELRELATEIQSVVAKEVFTEGGADQPFLGASFSTDYSEPTSVDSSESLALLLGVTSGVALAHDSISVLNATLAGTLGLDTSLDWYIGTVDGDVSIEGILQGIELSSEDHTGSFSLYGALGTVDLTDELIEDEFGDFADESLKIATPFTIISNGHVLPQLNFVADTTVSKSDDAYSEATDMFVVDPLQWLDIYSQDNPVQVNPGEVLEFYVDVPDDINYLIPSVTSGSFTWYAGASDLDGYVRLFLSDPNGPVYLEDVEGGLTAPIKFKIPDGVADPAGNVFQVNANIYLEGVGEVKAPVLSAENDTSDPTPLTVTFKTAPDFTPGTIVAKATSFELDEAQPGDDSERALSDFVSVNINDAMFNIAENTISINVVFDVTSALADDWKSNVSKYIDYTFENTTGEDISWGYDADTNQITGELVVPKDGPSNAGKSIDAFAADLLSGLIIKGDEYFKGDLDFSVYLKLKNSLWQEAATSYAPENTDGDLAALKLSTTFVPAASGVDAVVAGTEDTETSTEFVDLVVDENAAVAIADLFDQTTFTLRDGTESLSFAIDLPTNVKLQKTLDQGGTWVDVTGGRLVDSGSLRRFVIDADEVGSYQVQLKAYFSNTDETVDNASQFTYKVTPIAIEQGNLLSGTDVADLDINQLESFSGAFDITPVASGLSNLIVPDGDWSANVSDGALLTVPVYTAKKDASEAVNLKLTIDDPAAINNLTVTLGGQVITGSTTLVEGKLVYLAEDVSGANHEWKIASTADYRGDAALTASVSAATKDGSDVSSYVGGDTEHTLELLQNIVAPGLTITKTDADTGLSTFKVDVDAKDSTWANASNYNLLLTGVKSDTYFTDGADLIGANLGQGLWLLRGSDFLESNLSGTLVARGQDLTSIEGVILASDALTGSAATSGASKALPQDVNESIDPVVMVFGDANDTSAADALVADRAAVDDAFTFNEQSLSLTSWMPGSISNGAASGGAFLVREDASGSITLNDLFEDIDSLDAYIDGKGDYLDDSTLTLNEMAEAGLSLWFDSSNYGTVDAGELYSIPDFLAATSYAGGEEFDFTSRTPHSPTVATSSDAADRLSLDEAISINESIYDTETQLGLAALDVQPSAVKAPVISANSSNASNGNLTLTEDVPFDLSFNVIIDESDFADWGEVDKIVMAKIYGLPETEDSGVITPDAMVDGGVFVDPGDGSGAFWLVTLEPDGTAGSYSIEAFISFNEEHLVDPGTLSFQPLLSYSAPNYGDFGTFGARLGAPTDIDYQITPVADAPVFNEPAVMDVAIASGDTYALSELGLTVTSPDSNESLSVQLTIDSQAFASNVKLRAIQDQTLSSSLSETSIYTIPVEDLSKIELSVPKSFKDDFSISLKGISEHGDDTALSSLSYDVNFEVTPVALGVESHVITVTDSSGVAVDADFSADEGAMLYIKSAVTLVDAQENAVHKIYIDVTNGDVADAIVSFGGKAIETILSDGDKRYFEFEQSEIDALTNNLIAIETTPAFDGEISFTPAAYSIEPASANESDSFSGTAVPVVVAPTAGEFNDGVQSYVIRLEQEDAEVSQLMLQEGESAQFDLVVTKFDAGESVTLGTLPTGVTSVTITDEELAELADPANATRFRFEINDQSASMFNGEPQLQSITLPLAVTEALDTTAIDVPLSFTVMPGAATPSFGDIPAVRAEFDWDLGEVDLSSVLPKVVVDPASDDFITYQLDLEQGLAVAREKIEAQPDKTFVEPFIKSGGISLGSATSYSFQPAALSSISIATLGAIFADKVDAALEFDWSAMATDPYSGGQATSDAVSLYVTPKIELSQDTGLWGSTYVLGSSQTTVEFLVSGGLAGEVLAVNASSDIASLDETLGQFSANDSFVVSFDSLAALYDTDLSIAMDTVSGADVDLSTGFDFSYISLLDVSDESAIDGFFNQENNGQSFGSLNSSNQTFNLIDPSIGFIISNDEALYSDETKTDIKDVFHLSGTASDDWIIAPLSGESVLFGGGGRNSLYGNDDDNVLIVGSDEDYLFGGGGNDLAHISFDLHYQDNAEQEMDDLLTGFIGEKTELYNAISAINQDLITDGQGNVIGSISFKGIFADYQRNDTESDAIVFEGANVDTLDFKVITSDFDVIASDIWDGQSGAIYAYAAGESLNAAGESEFLSMLLMPEFALNDLESLDAEALGIINA